MGQDWSPNHAFSITIMHELLLEKLEEKAWEAEASNGREQWTPAGVCFVLSLPSPEGLMAELEGMKKYST